MKAKLYLFAAAVMLAAVFSGCKDDPIPPTVVTKPASGIAEGTATLNAEITNQGSDAVTSCGFYYNTSADMSYPEVVDANLDGSRFSSVISSLEPGKTYYYMAYAKSSAGMAEGEVLSFVTQAVKPTVETRPVSEVTTSGATLNAAIPSDGGTEITACGFYYSTSENMSNKATAEFSGTPDSIFSVAVSGLQSFTTYYYKAYATNALGSVEGEVMQFTTVIPPSVTTNAATDIYSASATLNGNVTNHGGTTGTIRGFVYGVSADNLADSVTSGTGSGAYSKSIAGLAPSATYYFKAFASNSAGTVYGEVKQFATKAAVTPTVQTNAATAITATTATFNGNVTAVGNDPVTVRGFVWGTSSTNLSNNVESGSGTGSFAKEITGLTHSTTYYYKAYATNAAGTSYGQVKSFATTTITAPTVQTNAASSISMTGATLNGNVTADGGATITARGFVYGTSASNLSQNVQSGSGTGSFTKAITGLAHSTTYYYKAYATNAIGTNYGDVKQFTTSSPSMPTVQTNNASSITSSGATLNGNVTADGGATVTVRGFVYGTSASDLSQNVQSGSGTGSFTKALTGLSSSTTYYYKAYATNSAGTAYGEVKQFTTTAVTTGTLNGHDWVDLGLPSGLRWATCNVGASTPTAYGNYYAWGETSTKTTYSSSTYTYSDNPTTLPSSADAATANWGSAWRMPTPTELNELINNCTVTWTTQNGVNGRLFTGPNGNSIFLPAAGYRNASGLCGAGSGGRYWSSSFLPSSTDNAFILYFDSGNCSLGSLYHYCGLSVRAVCQSQN
ncbi:MAG: hypothetical protein IJK62_05175 [Bacteroidales bacterium]|nr:hypothetical protein [Bacteroidales bacterium]